MSGKKKNKLPEWFNGDVYEIGQIVTNPFSGESYKLNAEELSMYDFIKGCEYANQLMGDDQDWIINDWHKGLDWFRENNSKAYMVLLD
tara:strand:- start:43 stop:306 length:264 start_codon:yes stop_codon:yes gene_type:complete